MDDYGLVPEALDDSLNNWNYQTRGARKPFLLYLIPTGQNPTGATMPLARREAIYKVAQKHDLFIVEDEPYYFLQMQAYSSRGTEPAPEVSREEFLASLVPSFLSLDSDGRVLRMESFSKVISPGTRTGWIVASQQLVDRFARNFEVSSQHPSGISQLALFKLLDEYWGHAGYIDWLINLRIEYSRRRDVMIHAFEKFLPKDVARWKVPAAGMFVSQ
jgi:aromatic amino acid aminotransferase I